MCEILAVNGINIDNFDFLVNFLADFFNIIVFDEIFLLAPVREINVSEIDTIKERLSNYNVTLNNISESQIALLPAFAKDWCIDKMTKLDMQRYERDKQDQIKKQLKTIDEFDQELCNIVLNKVNY